MTLTDFVAEMERPSGAHAVTENDVGSPGESPLKLNETVV